MSWFIQSKFILHITTLENSAKIEGLSKFLEDKASLHNSIKIYLVQSILSIQKEVSIDYLVNHLCPNYEAYKPTFIRIEILLTHTMLNEMYKLYFFFVFYLLTFFKLFEYITYKIY